jgi:glycine cleavage system H lipoate-binding protein/TusA-related sulfurtransferase
MAQGRCKLQIDYCDFPEDALYDIDNRVWVRLLGKNTATVGITSVHSALTGRLNKVNFKPVGTVLQKGKSVATIESVKYFGAVRTPLSGTLIESNPVLAEQPKLANDSPYELGWFVKVEAAFLPDELKSLNDLTSARESLKSQISQLRIRCFKAYPDYDMWEIGVECAAVLVRLNELIERCALNEVIHVVSDDPTADIEMERWSDETGQLVLESRKEGKLLHFIVKKVK